MIRDLLDAWKYGKQLANPAAWKIGGMLSTMVGGLIIALMNIARVFYPDINLSVEVQDYLTQAICFILAIVNIYIHKASSEKV